MLSYKMTKFRGIEMPGEPVTELIIHMVHAGNTDVVEFWIPGSRFPQTALLDKAQFERMVAWVNQQYAALEQQVRGIH